MSKKVLSSAFFAVTSLAIVACLTPAPDAIRGGNRFPACAKPFARTIVWLDASAGEGRSEKIMRQQKLRAG